MSKPLVFMMGEFEASFPTDRQYTTNHMWAQSQTASWRFGFTTYAVRLLQDVYFLDWEIDPPANLSERQQIGTIESKKAESDLFSPMEGELYQFNEVLMRDPSMINVDHYGKGWLFEMLGNGAALLTPDEYLIHLEEVWEVTQRTIKGQLN